MIGSRVVVVWGWWWMKGSIVKGTRKFLGVMEIFYILIVGGDFTIVYVCKIYYFVYLNGFIVFCV